MQGLCYLDKSILEKKIGIMNKDIHIDIMYLPLVLQCFYFLLWGQIFVRIMNLKSTSQNAFLQ